MSALRHQPAIYLLLAMSIGITLDRYAPSSCSIWLGLAAICSVAWSVFRQRLRPRGAAIVLLIVAGLLGACWHHMRWYCFSRQDIGLLGSRAGRPVLVEGYVASCPRWSPAPVDDPLCTVELKSRTRFELRVDRLRVGQTWTQVGGRVSAGVEGRTEFDGSPLRKGDRVRIAGRLRHLPPAMNPGEGSYADYLRSRRQLAQLSIPSLESLTVLEARGSDPLTTWLEGLRTMAAERLARYTGNQSPLAIAILLGMREGVADETVDDFFQTGMVHMLSISGLHVGILVSVLWLLARAGCLRRRAVLVLASAFVLFYAMLAEGRPPIVRAATLIATLCLARSLGRPSQGLNSLAVAGVVVLILNPCHLFRAGAQLSFLAVATLAVCGHWLTATPEPDPLQKLIRATQPAWRQAGRRCLAQLARFWFATALLWLVAMPLVLFHFHLFTPIALLLNVVLWVPLSVALYAAMLCVLSGGWCPPMASAAGWLCRASLNWIQQAVSWGREWDGGHSWLPGPALWWLLLFYGALLARLLWQRPLNWRIRMWRPASGSSDSPRAEIAILTILLAGGLLSWPVVSRHLVPRRETVTTFISVGHGTSVLVETPEGEVMLYDAGRLGPPGGAVRSISAVLWSRGITHLDRVVLSHADADHYNALPGLAERFSIREVCVSHYMFDQPEPALLHMKRSLLLRQIPVRRIAQGDCWRVAGVRFDVLYPPATGAEGSDNAKSVVLAITIKGRESPSILLTGDLEREGLELVLSQPSTPCDVLLAPHHGSPRSRPRAVSEWTSPDVCVISAGQGFATQPTVQAYRGRGAEVVSTAARGAITARSSVHGTTFRGFLRRTRQ